MYNHSHNTSIQYRISKVNTFVQKPVENKTTSFQNYKMIKHKIRMIIKNITKPCILNLINTC